MKAQSLDARASWQKTQWRREAIPRGPPPKSLHMSSSAARSRLLFSSFEIPSAGVISPTIAVQ